jgi:hypothetical protein
LGTDLAAIAPIVLERGAVLPQEILATFWEWTNHCDLHNVLGYPAAEVIDPALPIDQVGREPEVIDPALAIDRIGPIGLPGEAVEIVLAVPAGEMAAFTTGLVGQIAPAQATLTIVGLAQVAQDTEWAIGSTAIPVVTIGGTIGATTSD